MHAYHQLVHETEIAQGCTVNPSSFVPVTVKQVIHHFMLLGTHLATTAGSAYIEHKTFMALNATAFRNQQRW